MHHYCQGLIETNRATFSVRTRQERMHLLASAISNFDYVIQRASADFIMLPEIRTKKGENLILLGRGPLATAEFLLAIELKPDYWPPYARMSDFYKKTGDLAKAREWLEKGLSAAPNAKALQQRLAELGAAKGKRKAAAPESAKIPAAPSPPPEQPPAPQVAPQPETPEPPVER
jgi:tetratricopeptide (TPR) repeat protein